jgi:hypothetical protein
MDDIFFLIDVELAAKYEKEEEIEIQKALFEK